MSCSADLKNKGSSCCTLEAVVSFDDRGQLVLPKDLRKKFNLQSGEKLALISCMEGDNLCCISLVRAQNLQEVVQDYLAPVFAGMIK